MPFVGRIWSYRRHDAELVEAPGHGHTHVLAAAPDQPAAHHVTQVGPQDVAQVVEEAVHAGQGVLCKHTTRGLVARSGTGGRAQSSFVHHPI